MKIVNSFWILAVASNLTGFAFADEEATLGPRPNLIVPVQTEQLLPKFEAFRFDLDARVSDLKKLIGLQTPVKAQGGRGTCSIFSATGALESLIRIRDREELDLSENYLEYLVMSRMKSNPSEGSDTDLNFPAFKKYGTVLEETWPYETHDWTTAEIPSTEKQRAKEVCGDLRGRKKTACLLSHMDPDNDLYADEAKQFRRDYQINKVGYDVVNSQSKIKSILNNNRPMILSLEFFYAAWNHRKMVEIGLGDRDMEKWAEGEVGTPTDEDVEISRKHGAGHSIIVVGYNDAEKVYYFKNSWGTTGFGANTKLVNNAPTAGYGTITYEYAHNYGTFFSVGFENEEEER